jgi:hypothetical protein
MLKGIVIEVEYFQQYACSVYTLSKNGKEVQVTLTDTERANNKYNSKMAKAVEELDAECET